MFLVALVELIQIGWLKLSVRKQLPSGGIRPADLFQVQQWWRKRHISFLNVGTEVLIRLRIAGAHPDTWFLSGSMYEN